MSVGTEGNTQASRSLPLSTSYIPDGNPGPFGGGTYTTYPTEPTLRDYENVFGPSARDIKDDLQKYKRHGRWHLPDILKGPNPWLTDRIDGLITDATNSPFTSVILPYRYFDNVDGKIKWNVWSFDEAMASRLPYEAAARTLTQSKRSFAGYAVRHGLAINLEHNFMMTPQGRENFQNQLKQLIGSIQYSNDLDVHMALILAPSYEKTQSEKYFGQSKTSPQICREFVDLFGFMQKNQNALDILIEESKIRLKTWGGPMPDFMLCNSKLGFQLQMIPERTNYLTQGPDGVKRLKQGPDLQSYRGLKIIHTRAFSLETGLEPRDMLRRRVRVAEYYRIPPSELNYKREFEFYNEARDNWFSLTFFDLLNMARKPAPEREDRLPGGSDHERINTILRMHGGGSAGEGAPEARGGRDDREALFDERDRQRPRQARPFMGGRFQAQGSGRGRLYKGALGVAGSGGRKRASVLGAPAAYHLKQTQMAPWNRLITEVGLQTETPTVKAQSQFLPNTSPLFFQLDSKTGFVFTSCTTTGIFKFEVGCDVLSEIVEAEDLSVDKKNFIINRAKIWPPWRGWNLLLDKLKTEQRFALLARPDIFEVKRSFYRYGIKIAGIPSSGYNQFLLAPFGAYDEPNNPRHMNAEFQGDNMILAANCHRSLLLTTETIDILMSQDVDGRFMFEGESLQMVTALIQYLKQETEKADHRKERSAHLSLKVNARFVNEYRKFQSNYCKENFIWTFPDSTGLEAYSDGNMCCGFTDGRGLYKSSIERIREAPYMLTLDLLAALCDEYDSMKSETQVQVAQHEETHLFGQIHQSFESVTVDGSFTAAFFHILQRRLRSDAFELHKSNSSYYDQVIADFKRIEAFKRTDNKLQNPINVKCSIQPLDQVQARVVEGEGSAEDYDMYAESFFKDIENAEGIKAPVPPDAGGGGDRPGGDGRHDLRPDHHPADIGGSEEESDVDIEADWHRDHPADPERPERPARPGHGPAHPPEVEPARPDHPEPGRAHPPARPPAHGPREDEIRAAQQEIERLRNELERMHGRRPPVPDDGGGTGYEIGLREATKNIEIVVLRPNIEHYMLGIIMGLAGENLGNTLWGQTELSVYDDSMHGVWGMSYK